MDCYQKIKDTTRASVGKRTQTLRISAFAIMAKHEKEMVGVVRKGRSGWYEDTMVGPGWISSIDVECLETLIFGSSPP